MNCLMKIDTELTERVVMAKEFKEGDRVKYSDAFLNHLRHSVREGFLYRFIRRQGTFVCKQSEDLVRIKWDDDPCENGDAVLIRNICHSNQQDT